MEDLARPPHPKWELTALGGYFVDGGEIEIDKEHLSQVISSSLTDKLKMRVDPWIVRRVLDAHYGHQEYIMRGAGHGRVEVWVSPRTWRNYELIKERERKEADEKARQRLEAERRQREEQQRLARLEHRRKVQKGGYPEPHDWSPKGSLPFED